MDGSVGYYDGDYWRWLEDVYWDFFVWYVIKIFKLRSCGEDSINIFGVYIIRLSRR